MKCFTQYTRGNPNTINGEQLIVTAIYSSFNKEEIDALEKKLSETIAFGVLADVTMDDDIQGENK
jgi:hypothetical protein